MEYDEKDLELEESHGSDHTQANIGPQLDDDMMPVVHDIKSESEFDEWKDFDEVNEAALSDEEKLQEFEEILSAEEYTELWGSRMYLILSLSTFNNMELLGTNVLSDFLTRTMITSKHSNCEWYPTCHAWHSNRCDLHSNINLLFTRSM